MEGLYDKLKKIFSIYASNLVQQQNDFWMLEQEYGNHPCFGRFVTKIEDIKRQIENIVLIHDHPHDQIRESLFLINRVEIKLRDDYKDMIYYIFTKIWSKKEHEIFQMKYDLILKMKNDYFLSFTRRSSDKNYANYINLNHRNFIIDTIGEEAYNEADKNNENLFAVAINKFLNDNTLDGFFYPKFEQNNEVVPDKLEECTKTKSFIQIIQTQMLRDGAGQDENYCFVEYKLAHEKLNSKQFIFIGANSRDDILRLSKKTDPKYDQWIKNILNNDILEIPPTKEHNPEVLKEISKNLKANLCQRIDEIYEELITSGIDN